MEGEEPRRNGEIKTEQRVLTGGSLATRRKVEIERKKKTETEARTETKVETKTEKSDMTKIAIARNEDLTKTVKKGDMTETAKTAIRRETRTGIQREIQNTETETGVKEREKRDIGIKIGPGGEIRAGAKRTNPRHTSIETEKTNKSRHLDLLGRPQPKDPDGDGKPRPIKH